MKKFVVFFAVLCLLFAGTSVSSASPLAGRILPFEITLNSATFTNQNTVVNVTVRNDRIRAVLLDTNFSAYDGRGALLARDTTNCPTPLLPQYAPADTTVTGNICWSRSRTFSIAVYFSGRLVGSIAR